MYNSWDEEENVNSYIISTDIFMLVAVFFISQISFSNYDTNKINEAAKSSVENSKNITSLYVSKTGQLFLDNNYSKVITIKELGLKLTKDKSNDVILYTSEISLQKYTDIQKQIIDTGFDNVSYSISRSKRS